jgi:chromosome segregation ATPase
VDLAEERAHARREVGAARDEVAAERRLRAETEVRFHRLNGELLALKGDQQRLLAELASTGAEVKRLYGEEQHLTRDLTAQTDLVSRLYGEIERQTARTASLSTQIEAMEGTRAWRFHQWFQSNVRRGGRR